MLHYPSWDSQGDARYLISNSKDQTIKLWDIRRFSSREGMEASRQAATQQNWDYRWQQVPKKGESGCRTRDLESEGSGVIVKTFNPWQGLAWALWMGQSLEPSPLPGINSSFAEPWESQGFSV